MKFDPFKWLEIENDSPITPPRGRVHVMASKPVAVYVQAMGVEALAGVGTEIDVTLDGEITFSVEAPKGARVFYERPHDRSMRLDGEVFTNIDRRPEESGTMLEIQRELRRFHLEQRGLRADMARERAELERARKAKRKPEPDPEPDPEPEAEPEPEGGEE